MRFLAWTIVVVLIVAAVLIARGAETPVIRLVDHAAVDRARITLADLLPGTASPTLRMRAAAVDLGRAPQVGATRVLGGEWLRDRLNESEVSAIGVPSRVVVERKPRDDAGVKQVQAVVGNYLNGKIGKHAASSGEFMWPAGAPHLKPGAALNVVSEQWDGRTRALQLRLACSARRDCLPFYVTLQVAGTQEELRQLATKFAPRHTPIAPSASSLAPVEASALPRPRKKAAPVLTQPGALASMTVEARGIHIFTQVVCLERGIEGQIIRVRNPESKRVLRAQVVGQGRVRGPV